MFDTTHSLTGIKNYPYLCVINKDNYANYTVSFRTPLFLLFRRTSSDAVHVKNGDGKAKINIENAEVVENSGIKPADLRKAVEAVKQYKTDMIKAWKEYFDED